MVMVNPIAYVPPLANHGRLYNEKIRNDKMGTAASANKNLSTKYSLLGGNEKSYNNNTYNNNTMSNKNLQERKIKKTTRLPPTTKGPVKADHTIYSSMKKRDNNKSIYNDTSTLKPLSKKSFSVSDLRSPKNEIHTGQQYDSYSYSRQQNDWRGGNDSLTRKSEELLNNARIKLSKLSKGLTPNRESLKTPFSSSSNDISRLNDHLSKTKISSTSTINKTNYMTDGESSRKLPRRRSSLLDDYGGSTSRQSASMINTSDERRKSSISLSEPSLSKSFSNSNLKSGLVGLRNLGNTCFMNCILQCLCRTKSLRELICSRNADAAIKGKLARAFGSVMRDIWTKDNHEIVSPVSLKLQVQRYASRFSGTNQQDSQEFLRFFLEGIHDDLNRVKKKPTYTEIDDTDMSDRQKSDIYWKRYLSRESSPIQDIFVGQLKSVLTCTFCEHRSVTYDPFWDLSLPIPTKNETGEMMISKCFRMFTREETLDGDEKPSCEKCKKRRKCTKRFLIDRFPQVLVLHLKRFSGVRYRTKLETKVVFPYELNLEDYAAFKGQTNNTSYTLYGVSNHMGGTHGGHYTAYCKHPDTNKWYSFNDARVNEVSSSRVVSPSAYVLFYEAK